MTSFLLCIYFIIRKFKAGSRKRRIFSNYVMWVMICMKLMITGLE